MSPITVWKHSYRPFILVTLNFPWFLFSCTTKLSTGLYYLGRMEWGLWRRLVFLVTGILFYLCCLITLSFQKMYIFLGIKENNSWNSLGFCDIMYLKPIPLSFLWRLFFSLPLSPFSLSILCIFPGWSHSCLWLQLPSTWSLISSVCTSNKNIKLPVKNAHLTIPWDPDSICQKLNSSTCTPNLFLLQYFLSPWICHIRSTMADAWFCSSHHPRSEDLHLHYL